MTATASDQCLTGFIQHKARFFRNVLSTSSSRETITSSHRSLVLTRMMVASSVLEVRVPLLLTSHVIKATELKQHVHLICFTVMLCLCRLPRSSRRTQQNRIRPTLVGHCTILWSAFPRSLENGRCLHGDTVRIFLRMFYLLKRNKALERIFHSGFNMLNTLSFTTQTGTSTGTTGYVGYYYYTVSISAFSY